MPIPNLCINCQNFRKPVGSLDVSEFAQCAAGLRISPVTGEPTLKTQSSIYCLKLRQSERPGDCGPNARHFAHVRLPAITPRLSVVDGNEPA